MRGSVLADLAGERGLAGLPGAEERDNRIRLQLAENLLPVSCPLDHGRMLSWKIENAIFDFQAKGKRISATLIRVTQRDNLPFVNERRQFGELRFGVRQIDLGLTKSGSSSRRCPGVRKSITAPEPGLMGGLREEMHPRPHHVSEGACADRQVTLISPHGHHSIS